jgi:hypothetical protein
MTTNEEIRRKKNMVGIVAIVLLLVFTVLAISGLLPALVWIVADLVVALVANVILRRIGKPQA